MTEPTPLARRHVVELDQLEQDLTQRPPLTGTVARPPRIIEDAARSLDDLGRMSAEAVLTQYEETAKEVEKMGDMVKAMVRKLGQSLIECDNDMKVVAETAAAIRDKGKHSEALIEQVSALSKSIRDACADFKKRMG